MLTGLRMIYPQKPNKHKFFQQSYTGSHKMPKLKCTITAARSWFVTLWGKKWPPCSNKVNIYIYIYGQTINPCQTSQQQWSHSSLTERLLWRSGWQSLVGTWLVVEIKRNTSPFTCQTLASEGSVKPWQGSLKYLMHLSLIESIPFMPLPFCVLKQCLFEC